MSDQPQKNEETEFVFKANPEHAPVSVTDLLAPTGLLAPKIEAEELVGQTFYIVSMNRFDSPYEGQKYAYYCTCMHELDGEYFATVLGGKAVIKLLEAICELKIDNPIRVTLGFVEGGRYGGYYTIE